MLTWLLARIYLPQKLRQKIEKIAKKNISMPPKLKWNDVLIVQNIYQGRNMRQTQKLILECNLSLFCKIKTK